MNKMTVRRFQERYCSKCESKYNNKCPYGNTLPTHIEGRELVIEDSCPQIDYSDFYKRIITIDGIKKIVTSCKDCPLSLIITEPDITDYTTKYIANIFCRHPAIITKNGSHPNVNFNQGCPLKSGLDGVFEKREKDDKI